MLFFITNRYLLHITILFLAGSIIGSNLKNRQAYAKDVGQQSLLFALATDERVELTEEEVRPGTPERSTNYLGSSTIIGIPHIDFDYDEQADPVTPLTVVPGTIATYTLPTATLPAPSASRSQAETYIVQEQDTISSIAERFDVNIGTIIWNNGLTERQYIHPGDVLRIPAVSGVLVKVKSGDTLSSLAKRYGANEEDIASFNRFTRGTALAVGQELLIPGGRPPVIQETRSRFLARERDERITRHTPSFRIVPKPPDADAGHLPATRLLWPTTSRGITQYYGWRHTGIDIDGDFSSPIYASADGVVEKSGWNSGGYGLMVLIEHPNGMRTRYGHASKLFVKTGDQVKRGQVIAMVGTTGRSTGTHLHYEVYMSDRRMNPLAFIR